jgi:hypothetical protein
MRKVDVFLLFQEKAVVEGAGASGVAAVLAGLLPELVSI